MRGTRMLRGWVPIVLAGSLTACAGGTQQAPAVSVPIADFKSVAGKWEGTWDYVPRPSQEADWLQLTIREDGRFEAESFRTIGVFKAAGQLSLAGGRLTFRGERGGTATATLVESGDRRWLDIDALTGNGVRTTARLARVR